MLAADRMAGLIDTEARADGSIRRDDTGVVAEIDLRFIAGVLELPARDIVQPFPASLTFALPPGAIGLSSLATVLGFAPSSRVKLFSATVRSLAISIAAGALRRLGLAWAGTASASSARPVKMDEAS